MRYLVVLCLFLGSCQIFVEEPEVVIETYRPYNPYLYHYVWVRDPWTGLMVRRMVAYP